jgi:hypothetical protein
VGPFDDEAPVERPETDDEDDLDALARWATTTPLDLD